MRSSFSRFYLVFFFCTAFFFSCASLLQAANQPNEASDLVYQSAAVYRRFLSDPNMIWFRNNVQSAKGIFIVPNMYRGGFIIGGSGGRGILLAQHPTSGQWSSPAFYKMGSVSVGFQIGGDVSEIILLVMTDAGVRAMLSTDFKLGSDVAVAAGPVGGSAKAQTADILAFGRSKGAYGGISIEGEAIMPEYDWNSTYYGETVDLYDVLITQKIRTPQADVLRNLFPKIQKNQQETSFE